MFGCLGIGSLDSVLRVERWLLPASSEGHSGAGDSSSTPPHPRLELILFGVQTHIIRTQSIGRNHEARLTHPRLFFDDGRRQGRADLDRAPLYEEGHLLYSEDTISRHVVRLSLIDGFLPAARPIDRF